MRLHPWILTFTLALGFGLTGCAEDDDDDDDDNGDTGGDPTADPTANPTANPTQDPTADPTDDPTVDPTADPTVDPTADPTVDPTADPTVDPTEDPTDTSDPTEEPPPVGCDNISNPCPPDHGSSCTPSTPESCQSGICDGNGSNIDGVCTVSCNSSDDCPIGSSCVEHDLTGFGQTGNVCTV